MGCVCVLWLGNARAHVHANSCSILRPLLFVGSSKTRPNKRLLGFAPQGALFSGWVSTSALLSKSITERHTTPQDSTFAPSPQGSKVGCRFPSPCFALPLQNNTWPSGVCSPSQGLGQQFLFHFIIFFLLLLSYSVFQKQCTLLSVRKRDQSFRGCPSESWLL